MGSNKVTRRIIKSALPKPTVERVRLAVTENEPVTGVKPSSNTATTPVTVQTISESPKISIAPIRPSSDDLGTEKWLKVHEESSKKLETYQTRIDSWCCQIPDDDFWRLEIERVKGECTLFLGPASKHTQFSKMCHDPGNNKYKVEKEADLQAYWDALVAPSINDFCNRVEWLTKSSKMAWVDAQKVIKPLCPIGQSPARPARRRQNKLSDAEQEEQAKKDQDREERMRKTKQAAEERRAEMRKMMREKKRLASLESLDNKENACIANITVENKSGSVSTLTDAINHLAL